MLPAAYLTRIVQPVTFARAAPAGSGPLHLIGRDRHGESCYCRFVCTFECPRRFYSGQKMGGETTSTGRELRAWKLRSGRWFVCITDRHREEQRTRYSTRDRMPATVCLDDEKAE